MIGVDPHQVNPSATDGDLLATLAGVVQWAALAQGTGITLTIDDTARTITIAVSQPVVLIPHGGSVPTGTPVGALIFEKGA